MEVPSDSVLAVSTRSKQEAEREEQQQLKKLVLKYEEREEAAARQGKILFTLRFLHFLFYSIYCFNSCCR